jgi:hypothetical protein
LNGYKETYSIYVYNILKGFQEVEMTSGGYTNLYDGLTSLTQGILGGAQQSVAFGPLIDIINHLTNDVKSKIGIIRSKRSAMSIADMFDLQMMMNKLSQMSELSTSMLTAMNTSVLSMCRNMKG